MKNKLSDFIEQYYLENRDKMGILSVGVGMKYRNGKETDMKSIVFAVSSKHSNISPESRIPEALTHDGVTYLTDVIERNIDYVESAFCHNQGGAIVLRHRQLKRHADNVYTEKRQTGMSVNNHSYARRKWLATNDLSKSVKIGTMGGFAVDQQDGKLVGVSNNHVFTPNFFTADIQGDEHVNYKNDSIVLPGDEQVIFNDKGTKLISNHGHMTRHNTTVIEGVEYRLGQVKRAYPHKFTGNEVDVAICSVEIDLPPNDSKRRIRADTSSNDIDSYKPIGSSFAGPNNWATTQEIDSITLGPTGTKLFKSSRTTGAVGAPGEDHQNGCTLYCDSISFTSFVSGKGYKNIIQYKGNRDPSAGGDSGSFVYALIGDEWKVIGIHFAGGRDVKTGEDHALACRIDRVKELLDIKPWYDPIRLPYASRTNEEDQYAYEPKPLYSVIEGHSSDPIIVIDGKKYYQVGRSVDDPTHVMDGTDGTYPVAKPV